MSSTLKYKDQTAAKKIQFAWRIYLQKRMNEFGSYLDIGCTCGDWTCIGCSQNIYIPCRNCGSNCSDGDWERERFCSRRCMVSRQIYRN